MTMKKHQLNILGLAAIAALGLSSCTGLNKMSKKEALVKYSVTPNPLEMHGDSVAVTISVNYPAKYFGKKVILNVTPECGGKKFKSVTLLGEKAVGTGTKINYKTGGSYTYTDKVFYTPEMKDADLKVTATGNVKNKSKEMPARVVGHGTIITPYLLKNDDKPIIGKDKFEKTTPQVIDGTNFFVISTSTYTPAGSMDEKKNPSIKPVKDFIAANAKNPNMRFDNITISSYASPDGEDAANGKLAEDRFKKTSGDLKTLAKDKKNPIPGGDKDEFYKKERVEVDWNGFKSAVSASSIKDKQIILNVVGAAPDASKMQEIKNMSETYEELKTGILPQLRRSTITINATKFNRTDEQILKLARSTADSLSVEEILYAATLTTDMNEKLTFYKSAERMYPSDWRTSNNVGCILLMQNKLQDAKGAFDRAAKNSANNPIIMNNQAICMRWEGDRKTAKETLEKSKAAGPEVSYNIGIIAVQDGKYEDAVGAFGANKTFNAALAKVLANDLEGALATIDASPEKEDALSYYLKAIVGARKGNKEMMINNLQTAISKDPSLKEKAKSDAEFLKHRGDSEFDNLVK